VTIVASSVTEWITALSTLGLGILGFAFGVWQWRGSGFRPAMSATIDDRRQAMQVIIDNRGRGSGVIRRVAIVKQRKGQDYDVECVVDSFPDGYKPTELTGFATMRLVIRVLTPDPIPADPAERRKHRFDENVEVLVKWGSGKETYLDPEHIEDVSFWTLKSELPPTPA
jgi:hypothetical protein